MADMENLYLSSPVVLGAPKLGTHSAGKFSIYYLHLCGNDDHYFYDVAKHSPQTS